MRATPLVLVADDDADIRRLVGAQLRRAGFEVTAVADGDEALARSLELEPDLLLLDIAMPGRDGYAVLHALALSRPHPPPAIFLTARGQVDDRIRGLDAGAVDYVTKPFDTSELLARVRAALRGKEERDRLEESATVDPVTGLVNRRGLESRLEEAVAAAERYGRGLAVAVADADDFKLVNDRLGHAAGDAVLAEVGSRLAGCARASDVVGRYGGEEFVVVMAEAGTQEAERASERLRLAVGGHGIAAPDGSLLHVTVSVGVAVWEPGLTASDLLERADEALYDAKRAGKDRVALAPAVGGAMRQDAGAGGAYR